MTATASERLPPSHACACNKSGHVETAIMTAHVNATRNGRTIQKLLSMSAPSAMSWRVVRTRSCGRLGCMLCAVHRAMAEWRLRTGVRAANLAIRRQTSCPPASVEAATDPYLARAGFGERQADVRRLYDAVGSTPIWVRDGRPTI